MAAALVGVITGKSIAFIELLAGENTQKADLIPYFKLLNKFHSLQLSEQRRK